MTYLVDSLPKASAEEAAKTRAVLAWPESRWFAIALAKCNDPKWSDGGYKRVGAKLGLTDRDSYMTILGASAWVWDCSVYMR